MHILNQNLVNIQLVYLPGVSQALEVGVSLGSDRESGYELELLSIQALVFLYAIISDTNVRN